MAEIPSFIPKSSPVHIPAPREGIGILLFLGIVLMVLALVLFGGVYFYKTIIEGQIKDGNKTLSELEKKFNKEQILEFAKVAKSIEASKGLLQSHISVSQVFKFLEGKTLPEVRFSNFGFKTKGEDLLMAGEAESYTDLALQIALLQQQKGVIKSIGLSGISLKEAGNVNFSISLNFEPSVLTYR
ncbi:hypothetical protein HYW53_01530 [Candidatus Giovannonibacteria bacterium]|nr:hypothetical protein [Candidatus Giovannonibacteria bacterium]